MSPGHSSDYADQEDSFLQSPVSFAVVDPQFYALNDKNSFCFFSVIVKGNTTTDPKHPQNN